MPAAAKTPSSEPALPVDRHLVFGWWSLLVFLTAGIGLEGLHALKVGWYFDDGYRIRRLLWTLGHAHGTLLGLVHLAFGFTLHVTRSPDSRLRRVASPCLIAASFLLHGGFFLGGVFIYDGDPGFGVFLVPLGAAFLFTGVLLVAWAMRSHVRSAPPEAKEERTEPARKRRRN